MIKSNHHITLLLVVALLGVVPAAATPNTLTLDEHAAGWQLLYEGKSPDGWTANEHPESFTVQDGCIVTGVSLLHL